MIPILKNKFVWLSLIILIIIGINLIQTTQKKEVITNPEAVEEKVENALKVSEKVNEEIKKQEKTNEIMVDLKGAIKYPGVFRIEEGKRVVDVIKLAGGFKSKADQNKVNLAEKLIDEMVIYVPEIGEESNIVEGASNRKESEQNEMIDINHASIEELEKIPGVGPSKAKNIINYIETNGPITKLEQLDGVNGIGTKSLEQMKPFILIR